MISIQISDSIEAQAHLLDSALLEKTAARTMEYKGQQADLSIVLSDDAHLHNLNRQYLGINSPTDVLAFPGGETDPDTQSLYLGDVIISFPMAMAQAMAGGHSVQAELQLLVVHGVLHLLGYDHTTPVDKAAMWEIQAELLKDLGCEISAPPLQAEGTDFTQS